MSRDPRGAIVVTNARVLCGPELEPVEAAAVHVDGNRISRIGPTEPVEAIEGAHVYDASGQTVVPGLINAHEHITWRRTSGTFASRVVDAPDGVLLARGIGNCLVSLIEGVTTIRDLGAKNDTALILKQLVENGIIVGPRISCCGQFISRTGGHAFRAALVADGTEEVRRAVRGLISRGASLIKLMNSGDSNDLHLSPDRPQFTVEELSVAFDEAHRSGLKTTAHAVGVAPVKEVVEAGVDCVEHASFLDEETAALLAERSVPIVPTLMELEGEIRYGGEFGRPAAEIEGAKAVQERTWESLRLAVRSGITVGAGVDPLGDLFEEIEMLHEIALSARDALRAATVVNAGILGAEGQFGHLAEGMLADFIVVDGNPLERISDLRRIAFVVKDGVPYDPAALRAAVGASVSYQEPWHPSDSREAALQ